MKISSENLGTLYAKVIPETKAAEWLDAGVPTVIVTCARLEPVGDGGDDELRLAVGAVKAEPADGIGDLGVAEALLDQCKKVTEIGNRRGKKSRVDSLYRPALPTIALSSIH